METLAVEPGNVLDDRELELAARAPDAVTDQLGLEAVDERFRERVVVRIADRPDRSEHAMVVEDLAVVIREVLTAGVAVMNEFDIRARAALGERHPERVEDEVGTHVLGELP